MFNEHYTDVIVTTDGHNMSDRRTKNVRLTDVVDVQQTDVVCVTDGPALHLDKQSFGLRACPPRDRHSRASARNTLLHVQRTSGICALSALA